MYTKDIPEMIISLNMSGAVGACLKIGYYQMHALLVMYAKSMVIED